MNPVYKFSVNGRVVNPLYKENLSKSYAKESGQQFFRQTLSGNLRFVGADFEWMAANPFETEFVLFLEISYDGGTTLEPYWLGVFYKTDGKWDYDDKQVEVKVAPRDKYTEILANIEKEYNLLDLSPGRVPVDIDKRPLVQVYIPGRDSVSCFLGGTTWEQPVARSVTSHSELTTEEGGLFFSNNAFYYSASASGDNILPLGANGGYMSKTNNATVLDGPEIVDATGSTMPFTMRTSEEVDDGQTVRRVVIVHGNRDVFEGTGAWSNTTHIQVEAIPGSGAQGTMSVELHGRTDIYQRYLLDLENPGDVTTYRLTSNDIVADNRNYRYAIPYSTDHTLISTRVSIAPTKYGKLPNGLYYMPPASYMNTKFYPIARQEWYHGSVWFNFSPMAEFIEPSFRSTYTMRDAIPLSSAISVLLQKADTGLTYVLNQAHSVYLATMDELFITPKSNIIAGLYSLAAQKAPLTLKALLELIRDVYQCYWFIDNDNRLRIEHIKWFKNGETYDNITSDALDLTTMINPRNDRSWAFASNKFEYDKVEMAERYEFGWMDEVSDAFKGHPIEILSRFVERGKVETVKPSLFNTDIDYMLLAPENVSLDGFAFFSAVRVGAGRYKIAYREMFVGGASLRLQNGALSWPWLQENHWMHDLPSYNVRVNDDPFWFGEVKGVQRRLKQKVSFPALHDIDPMKLIKTDYGQGQIEKISVSLHSRHAQVDLAYDTEKKDNE